MISIVSVLCAKRLIVVSFTGMLQTVTSSAAGTIDVEDVVGRFGIDKEKAAKILFKSSNTKHNYHYKKYISQTALPLSTIFNFFC